MPRYDPSTGKVVEGEAPAAALVPIISPDGQSDAVLPERVKAMLELGYQLDTPEYRAELEQKAKFGNRPIAAVVAGAARSLTFGASDLVADRTGLVDSSTLQGLAEHNEDTCWRAWRTCRPRSRGRQGPGCSREGGGRGRGRHRSCRRHWTRGRRRGRSCGQSARRNGREFTRTGRGHISPARRRRRGRSPALRHRAQPLAGRAEGRRPHGGGLARQLRRCPCRRQRAWSWHAGAAPSWARALRPGGTGNRQRHRRCHHQQGRSRSG